MVGAPLDPHGGSRAEPDQDEDGVPLVISTNSMIQQVHML